MSVFAYRVRRVCFLGGSALVALLTLGASASAQNQPSQDQPTQSQTPPSPPAQTQAPQPVPVTPAPQAQPSTAPAAQAQTPPSAPPGEVALPQINVATQKNRPTPRQAVRRAPQPATGASTLPPVSPSEQLTQQNNSFDQARSNLYTTIGTTSDTLSRDNIQSLPQGTNAPVEKIILQFPNVTQDSAASGSFHVRNDHANVSFRINGVMLPDGVTGFGSVLDTDLIGSLSLITGALPAEYGMRTTGVLDITTRNDVFNNSGSISYYGGSRGAIQPSFEYGGTFGANCPATTTPGVVKAPSAATPCYSGVQYFFSGTYLQNREGIENPLPTLNAIHDFSQQERGFAYMSTFVDPWTRLTMMIGTATNAFQIPNTLNAPQSSLGTSVPGVVGPFNSAFLNENQTEDTQFGVVALQRSVNGFDGQLSYFTRYDNLHFIPDPTGDLLLNGVASDISRQAYTNGVQGDGAYVLNAAHTLRAGFTVSAEKTWVDNTSQVESCTACDGSDTGTTPFPVSDNVYQTGYLAGIYAQDEWKITDKLIMNYGARFDQMWQFTDANQLSPRVNFTYTPFENTTFHAGYARYFTPPVQVEASPTNIALFNGTTAQVTNPAGSNPVLPERSHYFDAGADQKIPLGCYTALKRDCATAEFGVDVYYKQATDLIDNGNFGQALVLDAFNYAKGINEGVEFTAKFNSSYLDAYFNYAIGKEKAMGPVSNQYLFDNNTPLADLGGLTEYQYAATHWIVTDHNQDQTASAGIIYRFCGRGAVPGENIWDWCGTKFTADMIYGSGFRQGDDNIDHLPAYAQFNAGISHEFAMPDGKPLTLRFDVVNLLDTIYEIRSGTGIGVFAPQFGPRRGYFFGVTKKL
jgi:TonB dependent receptor